MKSVLRQSDAQVASHPKGFRQDLASTLKIAEQI
jgi:hypothetical protein